MELLDGRSFDPAQAEGKPLLIYWWASFCPFCALQSPAMEALWRSQRGKGLVMLALSIDSAPQDATAYLHKKGYTFPAAWTSPEWRRTFPKPKGLPVTLLRGRDGRVALAKKGQMFDEDVPRSRGWSDAPRCAPDPHRCRRLRHRPDAGDLATRSPVRCRPGAAWPKHPARLPACPGCW